MTNTVFSSLKNISKEFSHYRTYKNNYDGLTSLPLFEKLRNKAKKYRRENKNLIEEHMKLMEENTRLYYECEYLRARLSDRTGRKPQPKLRKQKPSVDSFLISKPNVELPLEEPLEVVLDHAETPSTETENIVYIKEEYVSSDKDQKKQNRNYSLSDVVPTNLIYEITEDDTFIIEENNDCIMNTVITNVVDLTNDEDANLEEMTETGEVEVEAEEEEETEEVEVEAEEEEEETEEVEVEAEETEEVEAEEEEAETEEEEEEEEVEQEEDTEEVEVEEETEEEEEEETEETEEVEVEAEEEEEETEEVEVEAEEEEETEEVEAEDEETEEETEEATEEDGEEVFEITIKGKTYYTDDEVNGNIYDVDENGELSLEVGKFENKIPKFYKKST
jgi:hypothetical protein